MSGQAQVYATSVNADEVFVKRVKLENKLVGPGAQIYVIAEIGGNFTEFPTAKKMIDLAVEAEVDAVKIQTYAADTLATKKAMFDLENTGKILQHELFKKYELKDQVTEDIFDYCRKIGITCFSTPSHPSDVDLLEKCGATIYKIGSDDAVNLPLIRHVAKLGKPVLLSTGMCTLTEVQEAVDAILEEGNDQIILFHCTSNYPTHADSVNLRAMQTMQQRFEFPVGYSDHTLGIDTCYAAAVLGAPIVEFHFTYDKHAEGPDHMLSKDVLETKELVKKLRILPALLGDGIKRPAHAEMKSRRNNRKSIVLTADVKKGEKLTSRNIAIKRPGSGIPCRDFNSVLGKTASRDLHAEEALTWEDFA